MKFLGWLRRPRLVPIAAFRDRRHAEEAWTRLQDADIPASVDGDPGLLGNPVLTRLFVEAPLVDDAQRLVADLVRRDEASTERPRKDEP